MNVEMENLCVIGYDENEIFGNYDEDDLQEAVDELYIRLKEHLDKHYTVEEQMKLHYDKLIKLFEYIDVYQYSYTSYEDFKEFLSIYNEIAPYDYFVKKIEIKQEDEPIVIGYICAYGLNNYLNDFQKFTITVRRIDNTSSMKVLAKHEIKGYLVSLIKQEISYVTNEFSPLDIINSEIKYINELVDLYNKIKKGTLPLLVLREFIEIYNAKYCDSDGYIIVHK